MICNNFLFVGGVGGHEKDPKKKSEFCTVPVLGWKYRDDYRQISKRAWGHGGLGALSGRSVQGVKGSGSSYRWHVVRATWRVSQPANGAVNTLA